MRRKILHIKYVLSYFCKLNCTYCALTKEQRQETDFLGLEYIRLTLLQLTRFYKKNNYDELVIVLTGDELHQIPQFLDYMADLSSLLEKALVGIPKQNIRIKMHTNVQATEEFYVEHIRMLEDINRFAVADFETVYQSMYHSNKTEQRLKFIQSIATNVKYFSSLGLLNPSHMDKCSHIHFDDVIDFSKPCAYPKYEDIDVNFIIIDKDKSIRNGCGFDMNSNLFSMTDRSFCGECPHDSCEMLNVEHRL